MKIQKILLYLFALSLLLPHQNGWGQEDVVKKNIVVSGKVFSREHSSKNLIIITASELRELQVKNLANLFSLFTAVNIQRRGPAETSFDISMRGSNFEQVLLLVNGMAWNNPQTGHFNGDLPFQIEDIERVEIVRGGSSTTYGGGAFAGMVNIILKKKNDLHLSFTAGENKYLSSAINWGKELGKLNVSLSANKTTSTGYYPGRETDHHKFSGAVSFQDRDFQADFFAGFLDKKFGAADFYAPYPSYEEVSAFYTSLQGQKKIDNFILALKYLYQTHDDDFTLDRHNRSFFSSNSQTRINVLHGSLEFQKQKFQLTSGFEWKNEHMDSSSMGIHGRNQFALYSNIGIGFGKTGMDGGMRLNLSENGINHVTFFTGISRPITSLLVIKGSVGSSFRIPSFTEMFYHSPANIGDGNLQPETSLNYEFSLSFLKPGNQFDLSLFYRDQKNLIDWVRPDNSTPWQAVNWAEHDVVGVEMNQEFTWSGTRVRAGIERLWVLDHQSDWQSKYGLRFPDFTIKLNVMRRLFDFVSMVANYHYKQIHKTAEKGHFFNLSLTFRIDKIRLSLRGENLFNTIIEEIPGLPIPGRWFYVTISYR